MLNPMTTGFVQRLRDNDQGAWFELWETFGPVIRAQLTKWGKGRVGAETVRDLSQETLAALSGSIERYDPSKGARFSTWLLAIARHVLGDEIDRRSALKRGGGRRAGEFDERWMSGEALPTPDQAYETAVFHAKVEAAIRMVERETEFLDFSIFRMRILDGMSGKAVAESLGTSEPTVSRKLAKVRSNLREKLREVISTYSFTPEELAEPERNGLVLAPNGSGGDGARAPATDDALFDEAVCEIYHRQAALRREDQAAADA